MNKMLRFKDLFKIDFSSKGGGKLADKIFNKYNITKEEREEVKNEIVNGESLKNTYLRIKAPLTDQNIAMTLGSFSMFLIFRLCVVRTVDDLNKYMFIPFGMLMIAWEGFECSKVEVIPNVKEETLFNGTKLPLFKDWNSFLDTIYSIAGQELLDMFTNTFEEITKEEFYKDITTII